MDHYLMRWWLTYKFSALYHTKYCVTIRVMYLQMRRTVSCKEVLCDNTLLAYKCLHYLPTFHFIIRRSTAWLSCNLPTNAAHCIIRRSIVLLSVWCPSVRNTYRHLELYVSAMLARNGSNDFTNCPPPLRACTLQRPIMDTETDQCNSRKVTGIVSNKRRCLICFLTNTGTLWLFPLLSYPIFICLFFLHGVCKVSLAEKRESRKVMVTVYQLSCTVLWI